ncbi:hypothetical protein KFE25_000288 [Diacronema lutheri]|uniref:PUM-HD domain-containing protein n=2 Tax=Diacronema lutheri TaxID=2081491 RepID=A0A8J6CBW8_DIALT|nr:hypothetical protein KFE25_000288 [Diacronema lutheri]
MLLLARALGSEGAPPAGARALSKATARRVVRKLNKADWYRARRAIERASEPAPRPPPPLITSSSSAEDVAALARAERGSEAVCATLGRALTKNNEPVRSLIVHAACAIPAKYACDRFASRVLADVLLRAATPTERSAALDELAAHSARLMWHGRASTVLRACLADLPADAASDFAARIAPHVVTQLPAIGRNRFGAAVVAACLAAAPRAFAEQMVAPLVLDARALALDGSGAALVCAALRARPDGARLAAAAELEATLVASLPELLAAAMDGVEKNAGEAAPHDDAPRSSSLLAVVAELALATAASDGGARAVASALAPRAARVARRADGAAALSAAIAHAPDAEAAALASALALNARELLLHPRGASALEGLFASRARAPDAARAATAAALGVLDEALGASGEATARGVDGAPLARPLSAELSVHAARAVRAALAHGSGEEGARAHARVLARASELATDPSGALIVDGLLASVELPDAATAELLRALAASAERLAVDKHGVCVLRAALAHARGADTMAPVVEWLREREAELFQHRLARQLYDALGSAEVERAITRSVGAAA